MILDIIVEKTKERVDEQKKICPLEVLKKEAKGCVAERVFPFEETLKSDEITFICEVKKASPSKGVIAENFPYCRIAREYEEAGAGAISVLTEPSFFLGKDEYLKEIKQEVRLPLLRKDFVVDEYMIYEAAVMGADVILLICAILSDQQMKSFFTLADSLGLSVLFEVHDEIEVRRALKAGARIVGVNNRNLRDFSVDLNNSIRLREFVPESVLFISESGIRSAEDIRVLKEAGVHGVLIGETLMRSTDKRKAIEELRG